MNLSEPLVSCTFTDVCLVCIYPICNVDVGIYDAIANRDKQIELLKEEVKNKDIQITRLLNLLYIASDKNEELKEDIQSLEEKLSSIRSVEPGDPTN
jgi:hypothetical protein